jgi:hypothetical protein
VNAATVTVDFQCVNEAFGASVVEPATTMAVTMTPPGVTTVGGATDVATVSIAAAPGASGALSPSVALQGAVVRLEVTLDVVASDSVNPPPVSAAADATTTGAGVNSTPIPSVAPSTPWSAPQPIGITTNLPSNVAGERLWLRPSAVTYVWSASGAAGTTTCRPVDSSAALPASTVEAPVTGFFPIANAPFGGSTVVIGGPAPDIDSCGVIADPSNPDGSGSADDGCFVVQDLDAQVNPGRLSLSQLDGIVTFPGVTLDGANQTTTTLLNQVTVIDARGTNAPWTLTASLTDFTTPGAGTNGVIPATGLAWVPTCAVVNGQSGSVSNGISGPFVADSRVFGGTTTSATQVLCEHDGSFGGGTWTADATMTLTVPPNIQVGTYTSTMFLLVA